jgi:hypothetical protein
MDFTNTIHNIILKQKERLEKILKNIDIVCNNNINDMKVLNKVNENDNIIEKLEFNLIQIKSIISNDNNELLSYNEKRELKEDEIQKKINKIILPYVLYIRLNMNNDIKF